MATKTVKSVVSASPNFGTLIHYGHIMWAPEWNLAREGQEYGDAKDLKLMLTNSGWVQSPDGTIEVELIETAPPSIKPEVKLPVLKENEVKRRKDWWESLKVGAEKSANKRKELEVFEEVYVKDGKLREIMYIGTSGNRRNSVYFLAMLARATSTPPLPVTTEIPCIVQKYENGHQRLEIQVRENELKVEGFLPTTPIARLRSAKRLWTSRTTQTDLRKNYGDGNGQKLYGVLWLNDRWPEVRIYERMMLPATDPDHLKFGSQSTKDLVLYRDRSDPKALETRNIVRRKNGEEPLKPADAGEIDWFFKNSISTNKDRVMKGDAIRDLATRCPVLMLRDAFSGVAESDMDKFTKYEVYSTELNGIRELIEDGDFPLLGTVIKRFLLTPPSQRKELHDRLLKAFESNGRPAEPQREAATAK